MSLRRRLSPRLDGRRATGVRTERSLDDLSKESDHRANVDVAEDLLDQLGNFG